MWRLFKALIYLSVLGFIGLTGYAYLGDYAPTPHEVAAPVTLDVD